MKVAVVLVAVLAMAGPLTAVEIPNFGTGELYKVLQKFLDKVPIEKAMEIVIEYLAEDTEVQAAVEYFQSEEFKQLVGDVEKIPEIKDLMNYLHKAGVDIYKMVNMLNDLLGLPNLPAPQPPKLRSYKLTGGFHGLVRDIIDLLPVKELEALFYKELEESKAFKEFIDQLKSPEFQKIVNTVYEHPAFQNLLKKAREVGIDLKLIKDLLFSILGITVPEH